MALSESTSEQEIYDHFSVDDTAEDEGFLSDFNPSKNDFNSKSAGKKLYMQFLNH